jgi:hypothetical protein
MCCSKYKCAGDGRTGEFDSREADGNATQGASKCQTECGECEMAAREKIFVRYSDSVETLQAGETETIDQITATLLNIAKKVGERQRHTVRGVHAKSHGLLKAEVIVSPDLQENYDKACSHTQDAMERSCASRLIRRYTLRPYLDSTRSRSQGHRCGGRDAPEPRKPSDPGLHFQ